LLYERAADMGLAQAAMGLAGTYDAAELNKPHLRNVLPDAAEAKHWYQRAYTLGATDAGARLQRLGANVEGKK
jgi:TPR repeat protein